MKDIKVIFNDKQEGKPAIQGEDNFYILLSQKEAADLLSKWFKKVKDYDTTAYDLFEDKEGIEECANELRNAHSAYVLLTGGTGMSPNHVDCHIWTVDKDSLLELASYEDDDPNTQNKLRRFADNYHDYLANIKINSKEALEAMVLKKELKDIQHEINAELSIETVSESNLLKIERTTDNVINQVVKAFDNCNYNYRDYFTKKGLMTLDMLSDFILSKEMNEVRFRQFVKSVNIANENYQWHFIEKRTGQIKDLARTSSGTLISTRLYTIKEIVEEVLNVIK